MRSETLPYTKLGAGTWHVCETASSHELAPITISISSGAFHFQDYLTADEADALGDALKAQAVVARDPDARRLLEALES